MADPQNVDDPMYSTGIYICDGCDNPVNVARLILLQPNPERVAQFRDKSKLRTVIVAFCPKCNQNKEIVARIVRDLATRYNAWVVSQIQ